MLRIIYDTDLHVMSISILILHVCSPFDRERIKLGKGRDRLILLLQG